MAKRGSTSGGTASTNSASERARRLLENPVAFEEFRAKLSARDGSNVDKHLAAIEDESHRNLWLRLVRNLATLGPHAASTTGQHAIAFFIADGKYRKQVFALEDQRDGKITVYAPDILKQALTAKVLRPPANPELGPTHHELDNRQTLSVEQLTAQNTPNPSPFYKHMLGWNRTAIRITLPVHASEEQITAASMLCAVAAQEWLKEEPA
jgi:hypothetical protein